MFARYGGSTLRRAWVAARRVCRAASRRRTRGRTPQGLGVGGRTPGRHELFAADREHRLGRVDAVDEGAAACERYEHAARAASQLQDTIIRTNARLIKRHVVDGEVLQVVVSGRFVANGHGAPPGTWIWRMTGCAPDSSPDAGAQSTGAVRMRSL